MVAPEVVVISKLSDTPSIVRTAEVVVKGEAEDVCLTVTVFPWLTVPAAEVNAPPLMEYSPPTTEIGAGELIPETVIAFEFTGVLRATLF